MVADTNADPKETYHLLASSIDQHNPTSLAMGALTSVLIHLALLGPAGAIDLGPFQANVSLGEPRTVYRSAPPVYRQHLSLSQIDAGSSPDST